MARVVVTGGAGFIGSHLCEALVNRGDDVICVDNLVGTQGSKVNIARLLDGQRFRFFPMGVNELKPSNLFDVDVVYHQAASKSVVCGDDPEKDLMVNAFGTLRLALLAKKAGVRKFVHASTGSVYGLTAPQYEMGACEPASYYGISKLAGEQYVRLIHPTATVLRYFHVIGPRGNGVVPAFVRACAKGEPMVIHGNGMQERSFTSVYDVVRTNLAAADGPPGVYNVASGVAVSINELAEFIRREMASDSPITYDAARPNDRKQMDLDTVTLEEALDIRPSTDWRAVVRQVIDWEAAK